MTAILHGEAPPAANNGAATAKGSERIAARIRIDKLREKGWRVEFEDGQHAIMRDPLTVTEGQRQAFKEAMTAVGVMGSHIAKAIEDANPEQFDFLIARQAAAGVKTDYVRIAMFVETWSYDRPVPNVNDFASLKAIPGMSCDKLTEVANDLANASFLDAEPTPDPKAPTGSSGS